MPTSNWTGMLPVQNLPTFSPFSNEHPKKPNLNKVTLNHVCPVPFTDSISSWVKSKSVNITPYKAKEFELQPGLWIPPFILVLSIPATGVLLHHTCLFYLECSSNTSGPPSLISFRFLKEFYLWSPPFRTNTHYFCLKRKQKMFNGS